MHRTHRRLKYILWTFYSVVDFLLACDFVYDYPAKKSNSTSESNNSSNRQALIRLLKEKEQKSRLKKGREILHIFGQECFGLKVGKKSGDLPPFQSDADSKQVRKEVTGIDGDKKKFLDDDGSTSGNSFLNTYTTDDIASMKASCELREDKMKSKELDLLKTSEEAAMVNSVVENSHSLATSPNDGVLHNEENSKNNGLFQETFLSSNDVNEGSYGTRPTAFPASTKDPGDNSLSGNSKPVEDNLVMTDVDEDSDKVKLSKSNFYVGDQVEQIQFTNDSITENFVGKNSTASSTADLDDVIQETLCYQKTPELVEFEDNKTKQYSAEDLSSDLKDPELMEKVNLLVHSNHDITLQCADKDEMVRSVVNGSYNCRNGDNKTSTVQSSLAEQLDNITSKIYGSPLAETHKNAPNDKDDKTVFTHVSHSVIRISSKGRERNDKPQSREVQIEDSALESDDDSSQPHQNKTASCNSLDSKFEDISLGPEFSQHDVQLIQYSLKSCFVAFVMTFNIPRMYCSKENGTRHISATTGIPLRVVFLLWMVILRDNPSIIKCLRRLASSTDTPVSKVPRSAILDNLFSDDDIEICKFIHNYLLQHKLVTSSELNITEINGMKISSGEEHRWVMMQINKDIDSRFVQQLVLDDFNLTHNEVGTISIDSKLKANGLDNKETEKSNRLCIHWHSALAKVLREKIVYEDEKSNSSNVRSLTWYSTIFLPFHMVYGQQCESMTFLLDKNFVSHRYKLCGIIHATLGFINDSVMIKDYLIKKAKDKNHSGSSHNEIEINLNLTDEYEQKVIETVNHILQQKKKAFHDIAKSRDEDNSDSLCTSAEDLGDAYHHFGKALGESGEFNKQIDVYCEALQLKRTSRKGGKDNESVAETLYSMGSCYHKLKDWHNAKVCVEEAVAIYKERSCDNDIKFCDTLHQLGVILCDCGDFDNSLGSFQESLKIRQKLSERSDDKGSDTLCWIGKVQRERGQYNDALACFREARMIKESLVGRDHLHVAEILQNIGVIYDDLGKHEESLQCHRECLRIRRKELGDDHDDIFETLSCIANVYRDIDADKTLRFLKIILKLKSKRTVKDSAELEQLIQTYEEVLYLMTLKLGCESNKHNLHDEIATVMFKIGNLEERSEQFRKAVEWYNKSLKVRKIMKDRNNIGNILNSLGIAHAKRRSYSKAMKCFEDSLLLRKVILGNNHPEVGETLHNIGNCAAKQGDIEKASESFREALLIKENVQGHNSLTYLKTLHNMGIVHEEKEENDLALECYEKCFEGRMNLLGSDHLDVAFSLHSIGNIYKKQNNLDQSFEYFAKSLRIKKLHLLGNHLSIATTMHQMGLILEKNEKREEAIEFLEHALSTYERKLGIHISTADILESLGSVYESIDDLQLSHRYLEKALALKLKIYGDDHVAVSDTLYIIGKVQGKSGDIDDSLATFKEVMRLRRKAYGKDNLGVAAVLNDVGVIQLRRGQNENAERCFKEALRVWTLILGEKHEYVGETLVNLGELNHVQCEYGLAIDYFTEAMSIFKERRGVDHLSVALVYFKLGKCYWNNENLDEAIESYEKSLSIRSFETGDNSLVVADLIGDIGAVYLEKGDIMKAREFLGESLKTKIVKIPHDIETAETMFFLGKVMVKMKYHDEAVAYFRDSMEIIVRRLGNDDLSVADILIELALVCEHKKDLEQSLDLYKDCLRIRKAKLLDSELVADTHHSIGVVKQNLGDYQGSLKEFAMALLIYQKCSGDEHLSCAKTINNIGLVYDAMREYHESMKYHKEALRLRQINLGKDHLQVANSLDSIAGLYQRQKNNEKALKSLKEAMRIRRLHFGNDHLEIATTLFGMGIVFSDMGGEDNLKKAMDCYDVSLAIRERKLGKSSIEVAQTFHNMGSVFALKQDYQKALEMWHGALQKYRGIGMADDHHMVACTLGNIEMAESICSR